MRKFAKIFDAEPSQILVQKATNDDGNFGIKLSIEHEDVFVHATISAPGIAEEKMNEVFDEYSHDKAIEVCNQIFGEALQIKFTKIS